ncbi:unnamed protein product [Adineta ricciae]|uniref:Uncharacterized protein n=1 Tax=Adineta ricciae TaxID=249248 RepID=A0A814IYN7_ADIRI|nr:unnamed protein product [Adineta ricciae]CAF1506789.1 unnamed protein product [Adineta ricciae]
MPARNNRKSTVRRRAARATTGKNPILNHPRPPTRSYSSDDSSFWDFLRDLPQPYDYPIATTNSTTPATPIPEPPPRSTTAPSSSSSSEPENPAKKRKVEKIGDQLVPEESECTHWPKNKDENRTTPKGNSNGTEDDNIIVID